jgi:lysozyme
MTDLAKDKELIKELRRDEGVIPHAYQDSLGWWTIGVGRLIDRRKGGRLTDEEIDFLLSNDIKECVNDLNRVLPWFKDLTPVRQRVLVNMRFNLGLQGLLSFKNTLRFIENGQYEQAAGGMLDSKWATQVGQRANRLAEMMRRG